MTSKEKQYNPFPKKSDGKTYEPGYNYNYDPKYDHRYVSAYDPEYEHYLFKKFTEFGKVDTTLNLVTILVLFAFIFYMINKILSYHFRFDGEVVGDVVVSRCNNKPDKLTRMYYKKTCVIRVRYVVDGRVYANNLTQQGNNVDENIIIYYNKKNPNDITIKKHNSVEIYKTLYSILSLIFIYTIVKVYLINRNTSYAAMNGLTLAVGDIKTSIDADR